MKCAATTRTGEPCQMQAVANGLCFSHGQIARDAIGIFALSPVQIAARIQGLSQKQLETLELLCNGETYKSAAAILGVTYSHVAIQVSRAMRAAAVRSHRELIALYVLWWAGKVGKRMP